MAEFDWDSTGDESFVRSVVSKPTHTFNWSVENVSILSERNEIVSPKFCLSRDQAFYATLEKLSDSSLMITFNQSSGSNIKINHKYSIRDYSGKVFQEKTFIYSYTKNFPDSTIARISTPELMDFLSDSKHDTLIFNCVMEWEKVHTERYLCKFRPKPVSSPDNLPVLSKDLKAVYNASLYADVSLKVSESIVRAHKLILCARSSVFARMFETPMDERVLNIINIPDLDLPVLKDLVSYMYTGVLAKDDFETVYALYYAADKYDVSGLRNACVDVLLTKLDVENACRVLALADRHSDIEFKESLLDFIRFYKDRILETSAFKDLATPLKIGVKALLGK